MARQSKPKMFVRVRQKSLKNGNKSLYLDIYRNGERVYDFLKLYLIPERTRADKQQNANTLLIAEKMRADRQNAIAFEQAEVKNFGKGKMLFVDFLEWYATTKENEGKKLSGIARVKAIVKEYKPDIKLNAVSKAFYGGIVQHMRDNTAMSNNSIAQYMKLLTIALNYAVKKDFLQSNPFKKVDDFEKIHNEQSKREYLTAEELQKLAQTPCKNEALKMAYMFSAYTGLRISDIKGLQWQHIITTNGTKRVEKMQQKTKYIVSVPLSAKALQWLPEQGEAPETANIFTLPSRKALCKYMREWVQNAGITKKITFHTARHTFATLLLTMGADLYVTSKLLGHTNINTTQIYAKIIDKKREEAINLLDKI